MALRMTGLPAPVPTEEIESWINGPKRVAAAAAMTDTGPSMSP
jgi:hypothetical protein